MAVLEKKIVQKAFTFSSYLPPQTLAEVIT
jgi:hypothetical protein